MVPPRLWPMFIPHCKHISQILKLVEETITCYYMPTEHFAHNPMELLFINNILGMVSSIPRKKI